MRLLLLLFCIIICLASESACNKKEAPYSQPINSDLKKEFGYKSGSYWIYKDSISGDIDSVAVTGTVSGSGKMFIHSYPEQYDYIDIVIKDYGNGRKIGFGNWRLVANEIATSLFQGPTFYYPFITGQSFPFSSEMYTVSNVYNEYLINNTTYKDVAEVNHVGKFYVDSPKYHYWIYTNSEAGIVKMRIETADSALTTHNAWELQRCSIIR